MICWFTPYNGDDLAYLSPFKAYKASPSTNPLTWDLIWNDLYVIYRGLARIANLTFPLTLVVMPKWLTNLCTAILWSISLRYVINLAKANKLSVRILVLSLIMLFLPWYCEIFEIAPTINYIWTTAFNLLFLRLFFKNRNRGILYCVGMALLSFIAGGMHEGCSVPLIFGLGMYYLPKIRQVSRLQWIMTISYILGICLIFSTPGIWGRNAAHSKIIFSFSEYLLSLTLYQPITLAFAVFTLLISLTTRGRQVLKELVRSTWIVYVLSLFGAVAIQIHVAGTGRCLWFPQIFAAMALAMLLDKFLTKESPIMLAVAMVLCVITLLNLSYSLCWTKIMRDDFEAIKTQYVKSDDGKVFHDFKTYDDVPLITLEKAGPFIMHTQLSYYEFCGYYGCREKPLILVPKCLQNVDLASVERIDGNVGVMRHNGYLFVEAEKVNPEQSQLLLSYEHFGDFQARTMLMPFTHSSGKAFAYIYPIPKRYFRILTHLSRIDYPQ